MVNSTTVISYQLLAKHPQSLVIENFIYIHAKQPLIKSTIYHFLTNLYRIGLECWLKPTLAESMEPYSKNWKGYEKWCWWSSLFCAQQSHQKQLRENHCSNDSSVDSRPESRSTFILLIVNIYDLHHTKKQLEINKFWKSTEFDIPIDKYVLLYHIAKTYEVVS